MACHNLIRIWNFSWHWRFHVKFSTFIEKNNDSNEWSLGGVDFRPLESTVCSSIYVHFGNCVWCVGWCFKLGMGYFCIHSEFLLHVGPRFFAMVQKVKTKEWYPHYNPYFTFETRQSLQNYSALPLRFYVKSILENIKVLKLPFLGLWILLIW